MSTMSFYNGSSKYPPMKLHEKFKFGKYKGTPLRDVIDTNPDYISYLCDGDFEIDNEAFEYFEKIRDRS